jgi:integrase
MNAITKTNHLGIDPFLAIDRAELAATTTHQYKRAIELYLEAGNQLTNREQLIEYAQGLKTSSKAFLKSAIKIWAKEVEDSVQSISTPEIVNHVTATLHRLNAICQTIKVKQKPRRRQNIWLTGSQEMHLKEVVTKERDYLMISLMLRAGLRRREVTELIDSNNLIEGDMYLLRFVGKGNKQRDVPISEDFYNRLKVWADENCQGDNQPLFPVVGNTVYYTCRKYGKMIDVPKLDPHDLRRTFAQTALDNGVLIEHISRLLGHASVETTMRYLNLETQNLPVVDNFIHF